MASIRVVKSFTYRGVLRNFSNRYHFSGGTPSDSTHWTTLSDAIVTAEKAIFTAPANGGVTIVATVGYDAGSEIPVFNKTYSTAGTLSSAGFFAAPGDVCALVRYSTSARSTKNHPVYLFNYYHSAGLSTDNSSIDTQIASQHTAMGTYATAWISGFSDGTTTHHRAGPKGDLALGSIVETDLTHRDLPR